MEEVARLRRATGLSQTAFAKLLGVGQATVSRWETGKELPSDLTLEGIRSVVRRRLAEDAAA